MRACSVGCLVCSCPLSVCPGSCLRVAWFMVVNLERCTAVVLELAGLNNYSSLVWCHILETDFCNRYSVWDGTFASYARVRGGECRKPI